LDSLAKKKISTLASHHKHMLTIHLGKIGGKYKNPYLEWMFEWTWNNKTREMLIGTNFEVYNEIVIFFSCFRADLKVNPTAYFIAQK
jgi:hypothetical protein